MFDTGCQISPGDVAAAIGLAAAAECQKDLKPNIRRVPHLRAVILRSDLFPNNRAIRNVKQQVFRRR